MTDLYYYACVFNLVALNSIIILLRGILFFDCLFLAEETEEGLFGSAV